MSATERTSGRQAQPWIAGRDLVVCVLATLASLYVHGYSFGLQNQHIHANTVSVAGSGLLGGIDLALANLIDEHAVGVQGFNGTIQYNRIARNGVGIQPITGQEIFHNLIYDNTTHGVVASGVSDVRIFQNTIHADGGDAIRIEGGQL